MTTEKTPPTKAEFLEALSKNGINNLEDLVDAILPETGGYSWDVYADARDIVPEIAGIGMGRRLRIDMKAYWEGPDAT